MTPVIDTLTAPFRGAALGVNLVFGTLLGALWLYVVHAGALALVAIPGLAILIPWFVDYCLTVGQQAAYGRREMPAMGSQGLNPLAGKAIVATAGVAAVYQLLLTWLGPWAAAVGLALVVPAMIAAMVIEDSVLAAFNPAGLVGYVAGVGWAYPLLALILCGGLWACVVVVQWPLGTVTTVFIVQSLLIATFFAVGRLLHARAEAIGYTWPERADERRSRFEAQAAERAFEQHLDNAHRLAEAGRAGDAVEGLRDFVRDQGDEPHLYAAVLERLWPWREGVVAPAFARHYVDRLARLGHEGRALDVFVAAFDREPDVRPIGPDVTLALARAARQVGRADVADALYADFGERFPDSELRPATLVERAEIRLTAFADAAPAAEALATLEAHYPTVFERGDVRRLRERLAERRVGKGSH